MVIVQGASVWLQTASHVTTDIRPFVLLENAVHRVRSTLHVLEYLKDKAVNSRANVQEINLVSGENVVLCRTERSLEWS